MDPETQWTIGIGLVLVLGLISVIVPVLPGLLIMWGAGVVYGFAVGWSPVGVGVMALFTLLAAISLISSVTVPRRAAAESGASGRAQFGGLIGAVIGFFVIPIIGFIVGGLVGVLLVEYSAKGDWQQAWTATKGTAKGFGVSVLIDITAGTLMLATWAFWAWTVLS